MMRAKVILIFLVVVQLARCRPQNSSTTDQKTSENNGHTKSFRVETVTYKPQKPPALRDSLDLVAKQLTDSNSTVVDITLDTRTPPRIKQQQRVAFRKKPEKIENFHPGVAVPIDVDTFLESSTTQKIPKSTTTDGGLSTWIFLSGDSPTTKPARNVSTSRPTTVRTTTVKTTTVKPTTIQGTIFTKVPTSTTEKTTKKQRPISTRRPSTTSTATILPTTVTEQIKLPTKFITKVKASVLNNAINNKNRTTTTTITSTVGTTTTSAKTNIFKLVKLTTPMEAESTTQIDTSNTLGPEAKDGTVDLEDVKTTTKRPKRPSNTNKRKKNKNRRRKPQENTSNKNGTSTNTAIKQKPIGTQIYNYLSREVMPTVGVGLVGLVAAAGLASYFLFPFTALRRNYDEATDRRDTDFVYPEYPPGGEAEEDVIGKVIAGMPENSDIYGNSIYKQFGQYPNEYQATKINYGDQVIERHKQSGYTVDDTRKVDQNKFVVGNIPSDFVPVTPAVVPEHGPRSLKFNTRRRRRRRRDVMRDESENEVSGAFKTKIVKYKLFNGTEGVTEKNKTHDNMTSLNVMLSPIIIERNYSTEIPELPQVEKSNFFTFMRDLLEMKVRVGLDFLLKSTEAISKYLRGVQERVENVIKAAHNNSINRKTSKRQ